MENRDLLEKIARCEESYIRCFCEISDRDQFRNYHDPKLLDMYDHNFTKIKDEATNEKLQEIVLDETRRAIEQGKTFYKLAVTKIPQDLPVSSNGVKGEIEHLGSYVCDLEKVKMWNSQLECCISECSIQKIERPKQIEELIQLDLIHDKLTCGEDFCRRRASRRGEVYLSSAPCDSYLLYYKGEPVANCDLMMDGDTAKVEDFAVIPEYQRKGIGTKLLKSLIQIAVDKGAKMVYLNADEEDTPKEMYVKLGFRKVMDLYSLFWKLS